MIMWLPAWALKKKKRHGDTVHECVYSLNYRSSMILAEDKEYECTYYDSECPIPIRAVCVQLSVASRVMYEFPQ